MSTLMNGTFVYIGIGIGATFLSCFIPACRSDSS